MTNLRRNIASAAAAVAIAAGLLAGTATPALAGPPWPPTPILPGPSTPPLPPGDYRPVVQFPSCKTVIYSTTYTAVRHYYPSFRSIATPAGEYGAADPSLRSIIASASRTQTCAFGTTGTGRVYITETAINSATATTLNSWYSTHNVGSGTGGGPTMPGTSIDRWYVVGDGTATGVREFGIVSTDGWWITVRNVNMQVLPYLGQDAWEIFMTANPTRS